MKIGFLGTGHITSSVIEGILKSKLKIKKIFISSRNKKISRKLSNRFKKITIIKNNQHLVDKSDWIFLAITPQVGNKILKTLKFKKNKKIISFISTIKLNKLKSYTRSKNITRVIPLPFIGMKKGPVVLFPPNKSIKFFFKHLGKVIEIKKEKTSKGFWATSSFMAPFYNLMSTTSSWLVSKGVKRKGAEDYVKELFLALSQDAIFKNKISLQQLVVESQTPGGTNAHVIKELRKKRFYKIQQKALNSVFKKF
tara:strand:- start:492 stop:1250 length:759 start_codon:yes stop_codon:yes gene_type:complete